MDIAIEDCRRGRKQRRYYILKEGAKSYMVLPDGMYLGVNDKDKETILGEPSSTIYREVEKANFISEVKERSR